jgi:cytochrome b561
LLSARVSLVGFFQIEAPHALAEQGEYMPENLHAQAAEMHTNAAYAHAAAGCEHSTGDHLSTQDLTRMAYDRSQEAARLSKALAKETIEPMMT